MKNIKKEYLFLIYPLLCLFLLFVPIRGVVLDTFIAFSIFLGFASLFWTLMAEKQNELYLLPSFIVMATVFRLFLNVASTRTILSHGVTDESALGNFIPFAGQFVIANDWIIGTVLFVAFLIINFFVITKGSERMSELSSRFMLESLPGRQAALESQYINSQVPKETFDARQKEIFELSEYFSSLEGALKFIKGDILANFLIVFINLFVGSSMTMIQQSLSFQEVLKSFALLTVGDALLSQVPALFISLAVAISLSKVRSDDKAKFMSTQSNLSRKIYCLAFLALSLVNKYLFVTSLIVVSIIWYFSFVKKKQKQVFAATVKGPTPKTLKVFYENPSKDRQEIDC